MNMKTQYKHTRIKSTSYSCKEFKKKKKKKPLECIKQKEEDKIAMFPKGNNCYYCIIQNMLMGA